MKRNVTSTRPNWQEHAESFGFELHTMYGETYWNEGVHYEFTLDEIENDLEDPSTELHNMCMEAVKLVLNSEELLTLLNIPKEQWDFVAQSWKDDYNKHLYGRFDLVYDGNSNAKMLEYNADTPTSLYEAASYQWLWLEHAKELGIISGDCDQFNLIEDKLIEAFKNKFSNKTMFFSSAKGVTEDFMTVEYLSLLAKAGNVNREYIPIEDISLSTDGDFCTPEGELIELIFKLYPWEDMFLDDYSQYIRNSKTKFIEPAWKSILSNKGILPVLWDMYRGHKNLLPSYFVTSGDKISDMQYSINNLSSLHNNSFVTKPIFSREGSSVTVHDGNKIVKADDQSYLQNGLISQSYVQIPDFDGNKPVIGTWIVDNECVGMGIREDNSIITQDLSRFTPHVIV